MGWFGAIGGDAFTRIGIELTGETVEHAGRKYGAEILETVYGKIKPFDLQNSLELKLNSTFSDTSLKRFNEISNTKGGAELISGAIDDALRYDDFTQIHQITNSIDLMNTSRAAEGLDNVSFGRYTEQPPVPTAIDDWKLKFETGTGDQIRGLNAELMGGIGGDISIRPLSSYKRGSDYFKGRTAVAEDSFSITNVHHVYGLDDSSSLIKNHKSWGDWHDGPNPIVQAIMDKGWNFGNHSKNLVEVTEVNTKAFREAEKLAAETQLDGYNAYVHKDTINDAFGMSNYKPRVLDETKTEFDKLGLETEHFNRVRAQNPDMSVERYMDTHKSPSTGKPYKEGSFPKIKVRDENGKVFETLKFKSEGEWANRFKAIFESYQRNANKLKGTYDYATAAKKFKVSNRKLESFATTKTSYGPDHTTIHNIIDNELKPDPSTAIGKVEELRTNQAKLNKYSIDELADLLVAAGKESELVAYNVIKRRYEQLLKVYERYRTENAPDFELLPKLDQQAFFETRIAEISREGGVIGDVMARAEALKPMDNPIPAGLQNIFNFQPQDAKVLTKHAEGLLTSSTGRDQAFDNVVAQLKQDPTQFDTSGMGGQVGGDLQRIVND